MAATRNAAPPELRAEAVRRVNAGELPTHVARDIGVWPATVNRWVRDEAERSRPNLMDWFLYQKEAA